MSDYYQSEFSGSEIDEQLSYVKNTLKTKLDTIDAELFKKAETTDVLLRSNTDEYSPMSDYNPSTKKYVDNSMQTKVDKEIGKGLSSNDFTDAEKEKLEGVEEGANNYVLPDNVIVEEEMNAAFLRERDTFNPLYCNALKGEQAGYNITIADAVEGTPVSLGLYGATTETLADPSAEKSPDNPATITGIGESGSVTVTVTAADGTEETIEIPLSQPLHGILNQETKEWVRQDEIRVENGKVLLIRKVGKTQITENFVIFTFHNFVEGKIWAHVIPSWEFYSRVYKAPYTSNQERWVACPLFVSGWSKYSSIEKDIALGYSGAYDRQIGIQIALDVLGITAKATEAEITEAFKTFCSTRDDFIVYYVLNDESVSEEDISDTEAGRALLALTSQNGMTITNSEGAEMKAEYSRDINKALEELSAAVVASV